MLQKGELEGPVEEGQAQPGPPSQHFGPNHLISNINYDIGSTFTPKAPCSYTGSMNVAYSGLLRKFDCLLTQSF